MQAADINDIWERILQVAKQTNTAACDLFKFEYFSHTDEYR
ncbi:MAG: hypothetical protein E6X90_05550 [Veillonella sp.]|nr:hypothetical protein [Veillonella sp.]